MPTIPFGASRWRNDHCNDRPPRVKADLPGSAGGVCPRILGVHVARLQKRGHWSLWRQQTSAAIARAFLCRHLAPRAFSRSPSVLAAPSTDPLPIASPEARRPA